MTTATTHPNVEKLTNALTARLERVSTTPGDSVLKVIIDVRNGVPRKMKFIHEDEEPFDRNM